MTAIETCRTAALGGHVEACGHWRIAYNSCRNWHCPKCQGAAARVWLAEREADLLPVGYFHVVFTLPAEIADIASGTMACSPHPRASPASRSRVSSSTSRCHWMMPNRLNRSMLARHAQVAVDIWSLSKRSSAGNHRARRPPRQHLSGNSCHDPAWPAPIKRPSIPAPGGHPACRAPPQHFIHGHDLV
jgi:hypothetical protein